MSHDALVSFAERRNIFMKKLIMKIWFHVDLKLEIHSHMPSLVKEMLEKSNKKRMDFW